MSRERPSAEQIGRIEELAAAAGLDSMTRFHRLRQIVGVPVNVLSQLTVEQADHVIAELQADARQPTLPGTETR